MTEHDRTNLKALLKFATDIHPAQRVSVYRNESSRCVMLEYNDANSYRRISKRFNFSTAGVAIIACYEASELLRAIDERYAEKTDCPPLWALSAQKK
ncbi:MAG: hypothetical protein IKN27_04850 [Selenomonadaceae bacterium]|nr:hypothetical protein [Selenomonadaceae bacterium]